MSSGDSLSIFNKALDTVNCIFRVDIQLELVAIPMTYIYLHTL